MFRCKVLIFLLKKEKNRDGKIALKIINKIIKKLNCKSMGIKQTRKNIELILVAIGLINKLFISSVSLMILCDKYGPLFKLLLLLYLEFKNLIKMIFLKSNKTLFSSKYKVSVLNKTEIELKISTEIYKIIKITIKLLPILIVSTKIIRKKAVTILINFNKKSIQKY